VSWGQEVHFQSKHSFFKELIGRNVSVTRSKNFLPYPAGIYKVLTFLSPIESQQQMGNISAVVKVWKTT
jgi:hypothetical protein